MIDNSRISNGSGKGFIIFMFIAAFSFLPFRAFSQSVSVNTTGAPPDPSAGLDVNYPDKGLLIPRVALVSTTNPAPLAAHVAGMLVYNTATQADVVPGLYIDNGIAWITYSPPKGIVTGNMFYWNGTTWILIPPGTAGQKLQLDTSGIPRWI